MSSETPRIARSKIDPRERPREIVALGEGRTLAYLEAGRGPTVVLLHGTLMTCEDMWLGPMQALANDFRVLAVDRPGHGRSERRRLSDAPPRRQAEIIHDALTTIGVDRPIVVGHSAGGAVALAYGLAFPDHTAGVVALAPICFPEPRLEQWLFGGRAIPFAGEALADLAHASFDRSLLGLLWKTMWLPQVMPAAFEAAFPFDLARRSEQMIAEGEDAMALAGLARDAFDFPGCRVPVRIIGGSADIVLNNMLHGAIAARLIPDATFRLLPGVGHMLHHVRMDAVIDAIRELAVGTTLSHQSS